jgi:curved DNA-binding protein CbpA
MTGQLREHPLAELLHEITDAGLSGALRLEYERLKTVVYLADGEVVYAASNLRQHRLAECILRWQALPGQELPVLPAGASDFDLAAALLEEKMLSRESLEILQARQVTEVLRPVLLWTEGTWMFDARVRMNRDVRFAVDLRSLLVESARRLPAEFVASRFTEPDERVLPRADAADGLALLPTEAFVLSRIDASLMVSEVIAVSALPEAAARQAIYTLVLARLLERERWPRAFTPEMLARARSVKPVAQADAPVTGKSEQPAAKTVPPAAGAPATTEASEEMEVEDLFARMAVAATHYQVLGVRSTASPGEIKSSYHRLAKRFHPDRFYGGADTSLHAKVEDAFARIAQAYETLKDRQARATYDLKLSQQAATAKAGGAGGSEGAQSLNRTGPHPGAEASGTEAQAKASLSRQAEESFARGLLALKQGKPLLAIAPFGEAARLAPREARYHAHYGRALSASEGTWRQAEAEFKAAISLDSKNASYHLMLAEFYSKIGLPRRAQSEAERALAIDAQDPAARRLLDSIQATLKGQT